MVNIKDKKININQNPLTCSQQNPTLVLYFLEVCTRRDNQQLTYLNMCPYNTHTRWTYLGSVILFIYGYMTHSLLHLLYLFEVVTLRHNHQWTHLNMCPYHTHSTCLRSYLVAFYEWLKIRLSMWLLHMNYDVQLLAKLSLFSNRLYVL